MWFDIDQCPAESEFAVKAVSLPPILLRKMAQPRPAKAAADGFGAGNGSRRE